MSESCPCAGTGLIYEDLPHGVRQCWRCGCEAGKKWEKTTLGKGKKARVVSVPLWQQATQAVAASKAIRVGRELATGEKEDG